MDLTRDIPLKPDQSALLFIDVQNFAAHRDGAEFDGLSDAEFDKKYGWFFDQLKTRAIPNMQALQREFRATEIEVLYTTIESLTKDGRDRSLDYKITGFNVPKGSWDGKVIDELAPDDDEIVFPTLKCNPQIPRSISSSLNFCNFMFSSCSESRLCFGRISSLIYS